MLDEEVQEILSSLDDSPEIEFATIATLVLALDITRFGIDNRALAKEAGQLGLRPEAMMLTEAQTLAIEDHLIGLLSDTSEFPAHWVLWLFAKTGSDRALGLVQGMAERFLAGAALDARLAEEMVGYLSSFSGRPGMRRLLDRLGADPHWPASGSLRSLRDLLQE